MASSGKNSCEIHEESLDRIQKTLGSHVVSMFRALAEHAVPQTHMHWITGADNTDGKLIPVITFSLVEDIRGEV